MKYIRQGIVLFVLILQAPWLMAEVESSFESVLTDQKILADAMRQYPRSWQGKDGDKNIMLQFTTFNPKQVRGYYQLDGRRTTFVTQLHVTKLLQVYQIKLHDTNRPEGDLLFWIDLKEHSQLIIDKSLPRHATKQYRFILKSVQNSNAMYKPQHKLTSIRNNNEQKINIAHRVGCGDPANCTCT